MLITTKLRPPRIGPDVIERPRIERRLEVARELPFICIAAPAGYGKSTLVAQWLESTDRPSAWVALDGNDSQVSSFMTYLVAAVESVESNSCALTREAVQSSSTPPVETLAALLANDLDALSTEIILVLDDYHLISNLEVHELITTLLRYPPAPVQLVLLTRFDPPLPLQTLRARGQMEELREVDLRFSVDEGAEYFELVAPNGINEGEVEKLWKATEGWVVGMKLASLLLRSGDSPATVLAALERGIDHVRQYLLTEILAGQPEPLQRHLMNASVLERISEPLWQAMTDAEPLPIAELAGQGLFLSSLDEDSEWYRFHHLFRDTLRKELERTTSRLEVAALHNRAAGWLEENGFAEEALRHLVRSGNETETSRLIKASRVALMRRENWGQLSRWMSYLPEGLVSRDAELLLARAWLQEDTYRYPEMVATLASLAELLALFPAGAHRNRLSAEADALSAGTAYLNGDTREVVRLSARALESLPTSNHWARGFASALLAFGYQMDGNPAAADALLAKSLKGQDVPGTSFEALILTTYSFLHWMEADVVRLMRTATLLLRKGEKSQLAKSAGYARYALGVAQLEADDLDGALRTLAPLRNSRLDNELPNALYGVIAMALAAEGLGESERARGLATEAATQALAANNADAIAVAGAFDAELAVRQGRLAEAAAWARSFVPLAHRLRNRFYQPELTLARVLLDLGTPESLDRAGPLIADLHTQLAKIHARRHLIDLLPLKALWHDALGERETALGVLGEAVTSACAGSLRRPFRDLGPPLATLLAQLDLEGEEAAFVDSILKPLAPSVRETEQVPKAHNSKPASDFMGESFTVRELDVLSLLAQRLSNKEVGERLGISPATVKRHNANIFEKLQVSGGRREAVAKAQSLGVFG
jgi:LuxR family maltose regulon positive regulatory protein